MLQNRFAKHLFSEQILNTIKLIIQKAFATRQIGDDDDHDNGDDDDHNDDDDLVIDCLHWDHLVVPLTGLLHESRGFSQNLKV